MSLMDNWKTDMESCDEGGLVANPNFEVLATFRYDPGFARQSASKKEIFETPDPRLGLRDEDIRQQIINEDYSSYLGVREVNFGGDLLENIQHPDAWKHDCKTIVCQRVEDMLQVIYERFFLLDEQYQRIRIALSYFKIDFSTSLNDLLKLLVENLINCKEGNAEYHEKIQKMINERQCYKMRVLVSKTGNIRIEAIPMLMEPILKLPTDYDSVSTYFIKTMLNGFLIDSTINWDVVVSSEPLNASAFTSFKTTSRDHYARARVRMQTAINNLRGSEPTSSVSKCEILFSNKSGLLMEGSITNVAVIQKDPNGSKKYVTPRLATGCLCGTMRHYLLRLGLIEEGDIDIGSLTVGNEVLLFNGVMGCIKGTVKTKY
ncbi:BCN_G0017200.mRNA.1.CDS.1 [Saccharomyces cerevisiae]|nr:BCN_G0017200.mRNA.1.CDS.1 [Saccharomyces cerevisiae]CAI4528216.1 BCE_3a_G0017090.mRNA.1.CDS.1 [Saccharomyces cerevisiae]CAI7152521.1 BCN_G0017200.mRNA.1.CDS.1 [Saccharomyces cerevisiae]CAI7154466.1 BCE_3a_G0017090.mRNA.1.CDS.1 [Saccharomyces cerevisiae]